jgi:cell division protein FtsI/penicillin-binding protein 2
VVAAVVDDQGEIPVLPGPTNRVIEEHVARDIAFMMVGTTESGTAYKGFHDRRGRKFLPDLEVAGKTGTLTRRSPSYLQYSWFVGFAPADDPEVVIAVLLGNPERWHLKAHTAARIVLQKAF